MNEKAIAFALALSALAAACTDQELAAGGGGGGVGGGTGGAGGGVGGGAGGGGPLGPDASVSCEGPPGLYQDDACEVLADGVVPYRPRFPLWSDGAEKQRFVSIPEGSHIDVSNPDGFIFPVGTRFWKTFVVGGLRVETRMLTKVNEGEGVAAWDYVAYAWNETQDGVTAVPQGQMNVLGTEHDIPSTSDCEQCHAPVAADMALGFSAIQLNHDLGGLNLAALDDGGWFEAGQSVSTADADVPGDAVASAALGYLHANCGHCHDDGIVSAPAGLRMRLHVDDTTVTGTQAYLTAVNQPALWQTPPPDPATVDRIEPGFPDQSAIWLRMSLGEMPLIGTDVVDTDGGLADVGAWITALGGGP